MKILVVDDHPDERLKIRSILEGREWEVFEACNGAEAISVLYDIEPDLIISDIFMPIIDGYMLCREVRRNPRSRHIPFLFCTGTFITRDDESLALQVGASAYLRKPVPAVDLLAQIDRLTAQDAPEARVTTAEQPQVDRKYAEALFRKLSEKASKLDEMQRFLETERDWASTLKSIRRTRGLKQAALAELLGVDQSRISRWEAGKENPNIGAQKILLEMLKS